MFFENFKQICQEKGTSMSAVLQELGLSTSKLTAWKNGSIPKEKYVKQIAEHLEIPVDYLLGFTEVKSQSALSKIKQTMSANPQRIVSLRGGVRILDSERNIISKYMKCSLSYLFGNEQEYEPQENDTAIEFSDVGAVTIIYDVLDRCASSEEFRVLQIQISRIIIHNLALRGIGKEQLMERKAFEAAKLDYLFGEKSSGGKAAHYGFNFTDLMRIRDEFGISAEVLLTGEE
jgi:transcriptional regulator with XRE-family HTH domain